MVGAGQFFTPASSIGNARSAAGPPARTARNARAADRPGGASFGANVRRRTASVTTELQAAAVRRISGYTDDGLQR